MSEKPINVIYHLTGLKKKNYMVSINAEKAMSKITSIYVLKILLVNYEHKGIYLI